MKGAVFLLKGLWAHEHDEDLQIALHEAFDAARRKLEDHVRVQRGDVKTHRPGPTGE